MSTPSEAVGAAGYISVYDVNTDTTALLFGTWTRPNELVYSATTQPTSLTPGKYLGMRVRGDFSPWLDAGLDHMGESPVSFQVKVRGLADTLSFSADFEPDPRKPGNALFRTSNGLRGPMIETHNSPVLVVFVIGLCLGAVLVDKAIESGVTFSGEFTVNATQGDLGVKVEVGTREEPPTPTGGDGGDGEGGEEGPS